MECRKENISIWNIIIIIIIISIGSSSGGIAAMMDVVMCVGSLTRS